MQRIDTVLPGKYVIGTYGPTRHGVDNLPHSCLYRGLNTGTLHGTHSIPPLSRRLLVLFLFLFLRCSGGAAITANDGRDDESADPEE